jgi:hypothetical protein
VEFCLQDVVAIGIFVSSSDIFHRICSLIRNLWPFTPQLQMSTRNRAVLLESDFDFDDGVHPSPPPPPPGFDTTNWRHVTFRIRCLTPHTILLFAFYKKNDYWNYTTSFVQKKTPLKKKEPPHPLTPSSGETPSSPHTHTHTHTTHTTSSVSCWKKWI